jgi:hypothetical protein
MCLCWRLWPGSLHGSLHRRYLARSYQLYVWRDGLSEVVSSPTTFRHFLEDIVCAFARAYRRRVVISQRRVAAHMSAFFLLQIRINGECSVEHFRVGPALHPSAVRVCMCAAYMKVCAQHTETRGSGRRLWRTIIKLLPNSRCKQTLAI